MTKLAHIYLADDSKPAIVAAMHHNADGIYYEQDDAIAVRNWREPLHLGEVLRSAIGRFSFRGQNLRDSKRSEWSAYRAAGCRSVREFESSYLCISVRPANEAEVTYIFEARPIGEDDIALSVSCNPHLDAEISRLLLRLYDSCSRWSSIVAESIKGKSSAESGLV